MKKALFFALIALSAAGLNGQVLNVKSIERIDVPQTEATSLVVGLSPAGDYLLLSSPSKQGLVRYDFATKATTAITDVPGAGVGVLIGGDGKNIVYRERSINDEHLVFTAVNSLDLTTNVKTQLVAPTRDLNAVAIDRGMTAVTVAEGKLRARSLKGGSANVARPVLSNVDLKLRLTVDGVTQPFTPQGDDLRYIWASVSPDGQRVLYYVSGVGCFSCRLDQSDMVALGRLRAPVWLDDNTVVGMHDEDNGVYTTSSSIVAKRLDGTEQTLTGDNVVAMYPHVASGVGKIAFSTPDGEAYIINFEK